MNIMNYDNRVAVIGFSSATSPLEPTWPATHRALLPIAGKPVIVHLLEQLLRDGITHLRIAGAIQSYAVQKRLRKGREWGLTIRYSDLHGADLRAQTLLECGSCLYLPGDYLHEFDVNELQARGTSCMADPSVRHEEAGYWHMDQRGVRHYTVQSASARSYARNPLLTVRQFHQANVSAAAGSNSGLVVPGRRVSDGVQVDWDTHISPDAQLSDGVAIGKHCRVASRVKLKGPCVISNGVVISRDTHLRNVTVLPNCFIGPGTRLRDAVVTPEGVFDLDGKFWPMVDHPLVGRARGNNEDKTGIPSEKLSALGTSVGVTS